MNNFLISFRDENFEEHSGVLVDQHYEAVSDRWIMLISTSDGRLKSISHNGPDVSSVWMQSELMFEGDFDDDDDEEDSDV